MGHCSTSRKVAKFYLLGKRDNNSPYLEACKFLWWAVAVEEMKNLEPAEKSLKKLAGLWQEDSGFLRAAAKTECNT